MINNYNLIAPLLNFTEPDDFYIIMIMKRKKDQSEGEKHNHQSVRTLKSYCVTCLEYLKEREPEIIDLCEHFKARAYISINKLNHKQISLLMMERLAQRIRQNVINQKNLFDSIVGEVHSTEKRWIVDVDSKDFDVVRRIGKHISECAPKGYSKILLRLPTKNGFHFITERFNRIQFAELEPLVDIQAHNPTLYFLPNSLE
jgi:hypothetical protein